MKRFGVSKMDRLDYLGGVVGIATLVAALQNPERWDVFTIGAILVFIALFIVKD